MPIRKIEHVGIMVRSIERSVRFYQDILGMELKRCLTHTNGVIELAFLGYRGSDETELELIQGYNDNLPHEGVVHHLAFTVDDIEAEVERIRALDVSAIDAAITTLPDGSRYFFFHGPDGEWLELFQPGSAR